MLEAAVWGGVAASSLIAGAVVAFLVDVPQRVLGLILAFGAGVLLSTVAYELVADVLAASMPSPLAASGFAAGALTFFVGSVTLGRMDGALAQEAGGGTPASRRSRGQALAIVLGTVLDGIPESLVLGLSLISGEGVGVPFLVAVIISNVPESLGASADLVGSGVARVRVLAVWTIVVAASAVAAAIGFAALRGASAEVIATVQTFAAGALIAMLAESMIPEAYQKGGRAVGLATALGFAISALISFRT